MMRPIILQAVLFRDDRDFARSRAAMLWLLDALVKIDRLWLRFHPETPNIYESGVRYIYKDEIEAPAWQDIPTTLGKGYGDCKDFAAWRVAELLEREGIEARPMIKWRKVDGTWRFHALLEVMKDGEWIEEDPSKPLGMGNHQEFVPPKDSTYLRGDLKMPSWQEVLDATTGAVKRAIDNAPIPTPGHVASVVVRNLMSKNAAERKSAQHAVNAINLAAQKGEVQAKTTKKIMDYASKRIRTRQYDQLEDLVNRADGGDEDAQAKLDEIDRRAAAGDSEAMKALTTIKEIQYRQTNQQGSGSAASSDQVGPEVPDQDSGYNPTPSGGYRPSGGVMAAPSRRSPGGPPPASGPYRGPGPRPAPAPSPFSSQGYRGPAPAPAASQDDGQYGGYNGGVNDGDESADSYDDDGGGDDMRGDYSGTEMVGADIWDKLAQIAMVSAPSLAPMMGPAAAMLASAVPVVGPLLAPIAANVAADAAKTLTDARNGDPAALAKINAIKQAAAAGSGTAAQALDALQRVNETQKTMASLTGLSEEDLGGLRDWYRAGATSGFGAPGRSFGPRLLDPLHIIGNLREWYGKAVH